MNLCTVTGPASVDNTRLYAPLSAGAHLSLEIHRVTLYRIVSGTESGGSHVILCSDVTSVLRSFPLFPPSVLKLLT